MHDDLQGRNYLITGGTDGLGLATAHRLATHGAGVAVGGRDPDRLAAAVSALEAHGGEVVGLEVDVTVEASLAAAFDRVADRWGRLDGLVNGAGRHTGGRFDETTDAEWQADFNLKLLATIRGARRGAELMPDGGSIVNVLSIWARTPTAGSMPSSVYRAAGLALTKGLAQEWAPRGIRVNAILVGFVESNQWVRGAASSGSTVEEFTQDMTARLQIPLGRMGRAVEFAEVAAFLLTEPSSYVTGAAVPVDGGLSPVI